MCLSCKEVKSGCACDANHAGASFDMRMADLERLGHAENDFGHGPVLVLGHEREKSLVVLLFNDLRRDHKHLQHRHIIGVTTHPALARVTCYRVIMEISKLRPQQLHLQVVEDRPGAVQRK